MTTTITIDRAAEAPVGPDRHPVFEQYQGQFEAQPAYISCDLRTGEIWAAANGEIGNAVPMDVYHGHVRLAARMGPIIDGYESRWDGSNHVANFTEGAQQALYALEDAWSALASAWEEEPCLDDCTVCYPDADDDPS